MTSPLHHLAILIDVHCLTKKGEGHPFLDSSGEFLSEVEVKTTGGPDGQKSPDEKVTVVNVRSHTPTQYDYLELVKWLKEHILALLFKETLREGGDFDISRLMWTYKFYDSTYELSSKTGRSFVPLSKDSVDAFEKQLDEVTEASASPKVTPQASVNPIGLLSTALKSLIGDLRWPESSIAFNSKDGKKAIYTVMKVPRNRVELAEFMPTSGLNGKAVEFLNELLPKAFAKTMKQSHIQLNFVDIWAAYKLFNDDPILPSSSVAENAWDGTTYSRHVTKVLHHINGGRVTPFARVGEGIPLGLPSYGSMLKKILIEKELKDQVSFNQGYSPLKLARPSKKIRRDEEDEPSMMSVVSASASGGFSGQYGNQQLNRARHSMPPTPTNYRHSMPPTPTNSIGRAHSHKVQPPNKSLMPHAGSSRNPRGFKMVVESQKRSSIEAKANTELAKALVYRKELLKRQEVSFKDMQTRLIMILDQSRALEEITWSALKVVEAKVRLFKDCMITEGQCLVSTSQALVLVLLKKLQEMNLNKRDTRNTLEEMLLISFDKLNLLVIEKKNTEEEQFAFRECQMQILLRLELAWVSGEDFEKVESEDGMDQQALLADEIIKFLNMMVAYCKPPSAVEDFVNDVVVNAYLDMHEKLLTEISWALNITPSVLLSSAHQSPIASAKRRKRRRDEDEMSSCSGSSAPEDFQALLRKSVSQDSQRSSNSTFLTVKNQKKRIMISASKDQILASNKSKSDVKTRQTSSMSMSNKAARQSPKRVRRNLFDVKSRDPNDMKRLLSLTSTSSFARSPSLKLNSSSKVAPYSPRSPGRASPFFRAARSRRKLMLDEEEPASSGYSPYWKNTSRSPARFSDGIICPASPSTPNFTFRSPRSGSGRSTDDKSVIKESPELDVSKSCGRTSHPVNRRVSSINFYSESLKSRAWEKSGTKLMAARIKDSVDLTTSLTLNDLVFIDDSESSRSDDMSKSNNDYSPSISKPFNLNSGNKPTTSTAAGSKSPLPCSSRSMMMALNERISDNCIVRAVDAVNPDIEDLITRENFNPSVKKTLDCLDKRLGGSAPAINTPSKLDTPSKRVQFNLKENLVNTPSPARYPICATPKSILKDGSSNDLLC